jgi:hypothetical protein
MRPCSRKRLAKRIVLVLAMSVAVRFDAYCDVGKSGYDTAQESVSVARAIVLVALVGYDAKEGFFLGVRHVGGVNGYWSHVGWWKMVSVSEPCCRPWCGVAVAWPCKRGRPRAMAAYRRCDG